MTLNAILTACSVGQFLKIGKGIHEKALPVGYAEDVTSYWGFKMYSKCGMLESVLGKLFDLLPQKNKVTCVDH